MIINRPICPHCGMDIDEDSKVGKVSTIHGESSEVICPNDDCREKYFILCTHEINFIQIDEDGEEI